MPRHQKQVIFDPYTTYLLPPHQKQVNFDPFTQIKSSSIPHINQVNFDLNAITKPFSTHHKKQVNFNPHTETKLLSIERVKPRLSRPPHQNQVNSDPYTEIKASSIPRTEMKSISMLTIKPSNLWPASKHRVNFDYTRPHKNQVSRSWHLNQVNIGPHTVNFDPPH